MRLRKNASCSTAVRYLLDTNSASYVIKGNFPRVRERLLKIPMAEVGISVVTEAELRFGVARRPEAATLKRVVGGISAAGRGAAVELRGGAAVCAHSGESGKGRGADGQPGLDDIAAQAVAVVGHAGDK